MIAAGCAATLTKKFIDEQTKRPKALVDLPSKDAYVIDQDCLAVYGTSSNQEHNQTKYSNFPQKMLATDKRSRSGLWTKKGGRFGRKIYAKREYMEFKDRSEMRYQKMDLLEPIK